MVVPISDPLLEQYLPRGHDDAAVLPITTYAVEAWFLGEHFIQSSSFT